METQLPPGSQIQKAPSSVRIRNNQRRSRAHKQDHLHTLRERVRKCDHLKLAATVDMQRVAQAVAEENVRLRALLARHGVSDADINQYAHKSDEPTTLGQSIASNSDKDISRNKGDISIAADLRVNCSSPLDVSALVPVGEVSNPSGCETSCDIAASIIAQMRGDGDSQSARLTLGCEGPSSCNIKNTILFQVMDGV
ncbi:hypothetical protein K504DRAFT_456536 [Pleomassaria siparia CBS 279.74]|uniref:BZIP domain-containing protein n=1 Tax=Pleomassaria siparia CBS 279.74 TaxID=1314801 RepID=A0A6G1KNB6_9PLEO|nr:hypothetical protein K504DRAFT_456536 [Pleomassaria siparia CBS 279.74]